MPHAHLHPHPARGQLTPDRDTHWRPQIWLAGSDEAERAIADLRAREQLLAIHDTLEHQLEELAETRDPTTKRGRPGFAAAVEAVLGGRPREAFGNWVYYPWLARLVRVVPEPEFRELRTSRNRNKITAAEQAKLLSLDLAIIGLSVGRATAITLALEGIGGRIRLADFDALSLSNLNRLWAGIHELGVNKAVLTARTVSEIDPYIEVSLFPEGVGPEDLDGFLSAGGRVDILFEECDDLAMKIRAREAARRLGIPVLMETSDRGMLDIERFDLEPERPLFHGLAGELDPEALRGLTTYEKVPTVAKIIGLSTLSRRMAASLIDVDATLKTWPQLASAVALGGALNADAARRLALGGLRESGRFYVDLDTLVRDDRAEIRPDPELAKHDPSPAPLPDPLPALQPSSGPITRAELVDLLAWAQRAPSGGNSQPWQFTIADDASIRCEIDTRRTRTILDDGLFAAQLACGAAAEHLVIAASGQGLAVELEQRPDPEGQPQLAWHARVHRAELPVDPLLGAIADRCTNRQRGPRVALAPEAAEALAAEAEAAGGSLMIVSDDASLDQLSRVLARAERQRLLCARLHRDMFDEIRWTRASALETRDGLDVQTLELNPTEAAGMTLLSSWEVMQTLRAVGGGEGLDRPTREAVEGASALALVCMPARGHEAYATGGRALARVWLRATALGLALQPMSALLFMLNYIARTGGPELDADTLAVFQATAAGLDAVFPEPPDQTRVFMFRLAEAKAASARSLRRRVTDSLDPR